MLFAYLCLVLFFCLSHVFGRVDMCSCSCVCVCCLFVCLFVCLFCVPLCCLCVLLCLVFLVLFMICGFAKAGSNNFLINDIVDIIETFGILHLNSYICHIMI